MLGAPAPTYLGAGEKAAPRSPSDSTKLDSAFYHCPRVDLPPAQRKWCATSRQQSNAPEPCSDSTQHGGRPRCSGTGTLPPPAETPRHCQVSLISTSQRHCRKTAPTQRQNQHPASSRHLGRIYRSKSFPEKVTAQNQKRRPPHQRHRHQHRDSRGERSMPARVAASPSSSFLPALLPTT